MEKGHALVRSGPRELRDLANAGDLVGVHATQHVRIIVVATDDIRAIHEELVAKGIDFELPPTETPRGTQAMFRDPDGNALLLWEHAVVHVEYVASEEPGHRYQPFG